MKAVTRPAKVAAEVTIESPFPSRRGICLPAAFFLDPVPVELVPVELVLVELVEFPEPELGGVVAFLEMSAGSNNEVVILSFEELLGK
jgi:hypothetical protein